jgi:hypothetical protein
MENKKVDRSMKIVSFKHVRDGCEIIPNRVRLEENFSNALKEFFRPLKFSPPGLKHS